MPPSGWNGVAAMAWMGGAPPSRLAVMARSSCQGLLTGWSH
jgi:hypothetical protein